MIWNPKQSSQEWKPGPGNRKKPRVNYRNDQEKSDRHHKKNTLNSYMLPGIKKSIKKQNLSQSGQSFRRTIPKRSTGMEGHLWLLSLYLFLHPKKRKDLLQQVIQKGFNNLNEPPPKSIQKSLEQLKNLIQIFATIERIPESIQIIQRQFLELYRDKKGPNKFKKWKQKTEQFGIFGENETQTNPNVNGQGRDSMEGRYQDSIEEQYRDRIEGRYKNNLCKQLQNDQWGKNVFLDSEHFQGLFDGIDQPIY